MAFGDSVQRVLGGKIAGIPTWVLVVGGGIGLAIFAPKLLNRFTSGSAPQGGPTDNTGSVQSNLPDTIDPISGIPYSIEEAIDPQTGLPAYFGLYNGTLGVNQQPPNPNSTPTPGLTPAASAPPPPPGSSVSPGTGALPIRPVRSTVPPNPAPPISNPARYVNPQPWPASQGSLTGLAQANGITLTRIESLNPWIYQQRGTWDLIYPTDKIRVA